MQEVQAINPKISICLKPTSAKAKALWRYFLSHSSGVWTARLEYSYKVRNNGVGERTIPMNLLFAID